MQLMPKDEGSEFDPLRSREAISHIHEVDRRSVNAPVPDEEPLAIEDMAQHSPDGRPPKASAKRAGLRTAVVLLAACSLGVVALVVALGDAAAAVMAVGYLLVVALVAFPVWYSGWMRASEEKEAHDYIRHTHHPHAP
jgi:Flp pilus assembly protein TadB